MTTRAQPSFQWASALTNADQKVVNSALDECVAFLYKDDDEKGVRTRVSQLFDTRIIYPVIDLLKNPNADKNLQAKGAKIMRRMTWHRDFKKQIHSAGADLPLLGVLSNGTAEGKAHAAAALSNLIMFENIAQTIFEAGVLPPLMDLIKTGTDEGVITATSAVANIVWYDYLHDPVLDSDLLAILLPLFPKAHPEARVNIARALWNLSCDPFVAREIVKAGVVSVLVENLRNSANDECKSYIVGALRNITKDHGVIHDVYTCGVVPLLIDFLENGPKESKADTTGALYHLAGHQDLAIAMFKAGVVPPLLKVLRSDCSQETELSALDLLKRMVHPIVEILINNEEDSILPAAEAIFLFISYRQDKCKDFFDAGAAPPLLSFLEFVDEPIAIMSAKALQLMCKNTDIMILLCDIGAIDPFLYLHENGPLEAKVITLNIAVLLSANEETATLLCENNGISILTANLESTNVDLLNLSLRALLSLSAFPKLAAQVFLANPVVSLVQLLSKGSDYAKVDAAGIVCNLLKADPKTIQSFCEAGVVVPLITLLAKSSEEGASHASTALSIICTIPERAKSILNGGAVAPLVELLQYGVSNSKASASQTLLLLGQLQGAPEAIFQCGAVQKLIDIRKTGAAESQASVSSLLLLLLPPIVKALTSGSTQQQDSSSVYLLSLVHFSEFVEPIFKAKVIEPLALILPTAPDGFKATVCGIFGSIAKNLEVARTSLIKLGALPSIVEQLRKGSPKSKSTAAETIASISLTTSLIKDVEKAGALPLLVGLLVSGSLDGKVNAVDALGNLAIDCPLASAIYRSGVVKSILEVYASGNFDGNLHAVKVLQRLLPCMASTLQSGSAAEKLDASMNIVLLADIKELKQSILACNIISVMVKFLSEASNDLKLNAAMVLQKLAQQQEFRSLIIETGAIPILASLIKATSEPLRVAIAETLLSIHLVPELPISYSRLDLDSSLQLGKATSVPSLATVISPLLRGASSVNMMNNFRKLVWLTAPPTAHNAPPLAFPLDIQNMSSLRFCQLSGTKLLSVPENIGQLTCLFALDVSKNALKSFPKSLPPQLVFLDASFNELKEIEFKGSSSLSLRFVNLTRNQLSALPTWVGRCPKASELNFSSNLITMLPNTCWSHLKALKRLELANNNLSRLVSAMGAMKSLTHFDVSNNPLLDWIPPSFSCLTAIQEFKINGCALAGHIPWELSQSQGAAFFNRLVQHLWHRDDPELVYRCKLFFVGDESSGSTSLRYALEPLTANIQVWGWLRWVPMLAIVRGQTLYVATKDKSTKDFASLLTPNLKTAIPPIRISEGWVVTTPPDNSLRLDVAPPPSLSLSEKKAKRQTLSMLFESPEIREKWMIALRWMSENSSTQGISVSPKPWIYRYAQSTVLPATSDSALLVKSPSKLASRAKSKEIQVAQSVCDFELTTWDFSGRSEYDWGHRLFFNPYGMYIITWDMTKSVETLRKWIRMIALRVLSKIDGGTSSPDPSDRPTAAIIIVGTHLDIVQQRHPSATERHAMSSVRMEAIKRFLHEWALDRSPRVHVEIREVYSRLELGPDPNAPRNIVNEESGVDELRTLIMQTLSRLSCMGERVSGLYTGADRLLEALNTNHSFVFVNDLERELSYDASSQQYPVSVQGILKKLSDWSRCIAFPGGSLVITDVHWFLEDVMGALLDPASSKYSNEVLPRGFTTKAVVQALIRGAHVEDRLLSTFMEFLACKNFGLLFWMEITPETLSLTRSSSLISLESMGGALTPHPSAKDMNPFGEVFSRVMSQVAATSMAAEAAAQGQESSHPVVHSHPLSRTSSVGLNMTPSEVLQFARTASFGINMALLREKVLENPGEIQVISEETMTPLVATPMTTDSPDTEPSNVVSTNASASASVASSPSPRRASVVAATSVKSKPLRKFQRQNSAKSKKVKKTVTFAPSVVEKQVEPPKKTRKFKLGGDDDVSPAPASATTAPAASKSTPPPTAPSAPFEAAPHSVTFARQDTLVEDDPPEDEILTYAILQAQRAVIPSLLPPYRTDEELAMAKYSGWKPASDVVEVHRRFILQSKVIKTSERFQLPDDFAPQLSIWLFHEQQGKPELPIIHNWQWRDSFTFDIQKHRSLKACLNIEFNHVVLAVRGELTRSSDVRLFLTLIDVCVDRVRRFVSQYVGSAFEFEERAVCYKCVCDETRYTNPCSWAISLPTAAASSTSFIAENHAEVPHNQPVFCQRRPNQLLNRTLLLGKFALALPLDEIAPVFKASKEISLR